MMKAAALTFGGVIRPPTKCWDSHAAPCWGGQPARGDAVWPPTGPRSCRRRSRRLPGPWPPRRVSDQQVSGIADELCAEPGALRYHGEQHEETGEVPAHVPVIRRKAETRGEEMVEREAPGDCALGSPASPMLSRAMPQPSSVDSAATYARARLRDAPALEVGEVLDRGARGHHHVQVFREEGRDHSAPRCFCAVGHSQEATETGSQVQECSRPAGQPGVRAARGFP